MEDSTQISAGPVAATLDQADWECSLCLKLLFEVTQPTQHLELLHSLAVKKSRRNTPQSQHTAWLARSLLFVRLSLGAGAAGDLPVWAHVLPPMRHRPAAPFGKHAAHAEVPAVPAAASAGGGCD